MRISSGHMRRSTARCVLARARPRIRFAIRETSRTESNDGTSRSSSTGSSPTCFHRHAKRLNQLAVLHPGWAGRFARAAIEAEFQVPANIVRQLEPTIRDAAHQINPPAGAVILVPQFNIRRDNWPCRARNERSRETDRNRCPRRGWRQVREPGGERAMCRQSRFRPRCCRSKCRLGHSYVNKAIRIEDVLRDRIAVSLRPSVVAGRLDASHTRFGASFPRRLGLERTMTLPASLAPLTGASFCTSVRDRPSAGNSAKRTMTTPLPAWAWMFSLPGSIAAGRRQ